MRAPGEVLQRPAVVRRSVIGLGPAFVAGVAYIDPGNVASNTTAGARYGYLLVWVIVSANVMAALVQFLSAKLGAATGLSLAQLCRERYSRRRARALWVQAELVAIATDLAEVLGGAVALYLLFGLDLRMGALVTVIASLVVLAIRDGSRPRRFQSFIIVMLLAVAGCFIGTAWFSAPSPVGLVGGVVPRLDGLESLGLATAMLGATVMPHAIYLHSALTAETRDTTGQGESRFHTLRRLRWDVGLSMTVAGATNLAILVLAAAVLTPAASTLEVAHSDYASQLGPAAATCFAVALLLSGLASTAVGTHSGVVILHGFTDLRLSLYARRLITAVPALAIVFVGVDPTTALVASQVVLSLGIPFALVPLLVFTSQRDVMGELVNARTTVRVGMAVVGVICILNASLIILTAAAFHG